MKLLSLQLREWRSFQSCDLEFPDGLIGVRGPNGAGKTTIAEAIAWALFGKLRAGARVGDVARQGAEGPSSVDLTFRLGPTIYRVRRVVSGAATFWIGDSDDPESTQTRATNEAIVRELGIGYESFQRTVFARQKDVAALDPSATKQARTQHVERLLGLQRYRVAATSAKDRAKEVSQQLVGLREQAPDLKALQADLDLARAAAAAGDPAVAAAQKDFDDAVVADKVAGRAFDAERDRAARHGQLRQQHESAIHQRDEAQTDLATRLVAADHRETKRQRLEELKHEPVDVVAARDLHACWETLRVYHNELAALDESASIAFDEDAAQVQAARLADVRRDLDELGAAPLPDIGALADRVAALDGVACVASVEDADASLAAVTHRRDAARDRIAQLRARVETDEQHLKALDAQGADLPCPVCLRPFGDAFTDIRVEHERLLAATRGELDRLLAAGSSLATEWQQAQEVVAAARDAAAALARTTGVTDLGDAGEALVLARSAATAREASVIALRSERDALGIAVAADSEAERQTSQARAAHRAATVRLGQAAAALATDAYDDRAYRESADALSDAIAADEEIGRLDAALDATRGLPEEITMLQARLTTRTAAISELEDELADLAFDPEYLGPLESVGRLAETQVRLSSEALHEAKLQAQGSDQEVAGIESKVVDARQLHDTIDDRAREHREYETAANILADFRKAQSTRAWPNLEQGASGLLSDTTDGRYADVRMSSDFKLEIVDRGERFGLERYSGGEQDLANLCLRLAIADWVARERDTELGFVILDEVFGSQDEDRRQRLLVALRSLESRFGQLLIITHMPEIADLCDHQLVVTLKEPGLSVAEVIG